MAGLDLRRVDDVGKRISTSQLVGQVRIGAESNPRIGDTSDRERLVESPEVKEFVALLVNAVSLLENDRAKDRDAFKQKDTKSTNMLLDSISGQQFLDDLQRAVSTGASAKDTLAIASEFTVELDRTRGEIERRFVYYSRLATVGTIAEILIHEIRNRTATLGGLVQRLRAGSAGVSARMLDASERAVASLDRLADTFAPLANRGYRRGKRSAVIGDELESALLLLEKSVKDASIDVDIQGNRDTAVLVDPGELSAVLVNLLLNAIYWVKQSPRGDRTILMVVGEPTQERVTLSVSDSGPGVEPSDLQLIMLPGVTKKPDGIGMGLTVVGEIVESHGGRLVVSSPGPLSGACFALDLPVSHAKASA